MLTSIQIAAILGLLFAFGVPQPKVDEVRAIMEHKTPPAAIGAPTVQLSQMKPAYSYDELLQVMYTRSPREITGGEFMLERVWPLGVGAGRTSVSFNWENSSNNHDTVIFNGKTVLNKQGNVDPITEHTETGDVVSAPGTKSFAKIEGLTPNTAYTYQYVFHEEGREDTVIEKSFKTAI